MFSFLDIRKCRAHYFRLSERKGGTMQATRTDELQQMIEAGDDVVSRLRTTARRCDLYHALRLLRAADDIEEDVEDLRGGRPTRAHRRRLLAL